MDEELNRLINYGIEGVHYEVTSDGGYKNLDSSVGYESLNAWSLRNPQFRLQNGTAGIMMQEMFDEYAGIAEENGNPSVNPYAGFSADYSNCSTERSAVTDVNSEYMSVLQAGLAEDVDASVNEFREKLTAAGREKIGEELTAQWAAYCQERGIE